MMRRIFCGEAHRWRGLAWPAPVGGRWIGGFAPNQVWPNGQVQALNLARVKVAVD